MHPIVTIRRALACLALLIAVTATAAPLHASPIEYEVIVDIVGLGVQARDAADQPVTLTQSTAYLDLTLHNAGLSNIRIDNVHRIADYTGQLTALTGRIDGAWDALLNLWVIHSGHITYTVTNADLTENVFHLDIGEGARYTTRLFAALTDHNHWTSGNLGGVAVDHAGPWQGHFALTYEPVPATGFDPRAQLKITTVIIPEPAALLLVVSGLAMIVLPRRRSSNA